MKKDLMQIDSIEELNEYLEKREFSFHDISEVVYFLLLRRFEFDNSLINRLRKTHEKKIMKEMNYYTCNNLIEKQMKFEEDLKSKKLLEGDLSRVSCLGITEKCNVNWPLCIYDKFFKLNLINFLVFRTADDVNIIEDYFYSGIDKSPCKEFQFKINNCLDLDIRNKIELNSINENNNKNVAKTELNLTKVYCSNSNFTLKNFNIEINSGNTKNQIKNHNSSENINLLEHIDFIKYSTPETKKFRSVIYADTYKAPNIANFDLNTNSKIENNLDLHKEVKVECRKTDNVLKNKNEIIFFDNKSDYSNEDYDDTMAQDNLCLLAIKDEDLIENSEKEEDENEESLNDFNDISIDYKRNSVNKEINDLVLLDGEESIKIDRKNNFSANNCFSYKNHYEKSEDESNKRSHSNELKKIKDMRKENEKRIKVYRSLLINRRKHYCQIVNSIPKNRVTFADSKESKFLTAEINKRKYNLFIHL